MRLSCKWYGYNMSLEIDYSIIPFKIPTTNHCILALLSKQTNEGKIESILNNYKAKNYQKTLALARISAIIGNKFPEYSI